MIIQYISVFPNSGGAAYVLSTIAETLAEHGYATKVITWVPVNARHQYAKQLRKKNISVEAVNARHTKIFKAFQTIPIYTLSFFLVLPYSAYRKIGIRSGWQRLKNELSYHFFGRINNKWTHSATFRSLERSVAGGPCILHVHYLGWTQCREVLNWAKVHNIPTILHYHNEVSFSQINAHNALFCHLSDFLSKKSTIIVLSERIRRAMVERIGQEYIVDVVPNCINENDAERPNEVTDHPLFTVCCVSRMIGGKGIEDLIRAVVALAEEGTIIQCTIIGSGIGLEYFKNTAVRLGADKYIAFKGELTESAVSEELHHADAFVLPSSTEGLPIVLLKAMSLSLPVIVTPVGANQEIVEQAENGFLVEIGNVRQLGDTIKKLITDPDMRRHMGEKSREYFTTHFTKKAVWPILEKTYDRLA